MLVALEEFMVGILWLVKACLLLLYARMAYVSSIMFDLVLICCSSGLREGLAVKITTRVLPPDLHRRPSAVPQRVVSTDHKLLGYSDTSRQRYVSCPIVTLDSADTTRTMQNIPQPPYHHLPSSTYPPIFLCSASPSPQSRTPVSH